MLLSATMGATAFQKGLGMTHSMAHPLSSEFGIHHGLANALCLPACVQHTVMKSQSINSLNKKLNKISSLFLSPSKAEDLPQLILKFYNKLGIKMGLKKHNIKEENLEKLSRLAMEDSCHKTHPYSVEKSDFLKCFKEALIG